MNVDWRHWTNPDRDNWETVIDEDDAEIYATISYGPRGWSGGVVVNAAYGMRVEYDARGKTREEMLRRLACEIDDDGLREFVTQLSWPGGDL